MINNKALPETNGDGTVHPFTIDMGPEDGKIHFYGLTKREHFAGLAMQGMLAANYDGGLEDLARWSTRAADALLEELGK